MPKTEGYSSAQEGYAYIKKSYENTGNNAKNMADSFKLFWENIKSNYTATAAVYAHNLAAQARETVEYFIELANACEATAGIVDK